MPSRDQDAPRATDEPFTERWPRAIRLLFLLFAAAACWGAVLALGWIALGRASF